MVCLRLASGVCVSGIYYCFYYRPGIQRLCQLAMSAGWLAGWIDKGPKGRARGAE